MLGIGYQDGARIVRYVDELGVTFPILLQQDSKRAFADPGPGNWALDVVLDQEGEIVHSCHGDSIEAFDEIFADLLP